MQQIQCPFCALPMIDDGTLAGQLVLCPRCNNQMQMPGAVPPPVTQTFPVHVDSVERSSSRRQARKKPNGPSPALFWGAMIFLAGTILFGVAKIASDLKSGSSGRATSRTAYQRGYEEGYGWGQAGRNTGAPFDPTGHFEEIQLGGMRVGEKGSLTNNENVPQIGTKDFGDFREGFYSGYKDGFGGS